MPNVPRLTLRGCCVTEHDDYAVEKDQINQILEYFQLSDAADRRYTYEDAENLANFARSYINSSPEIAAALVETGVSWDNPLLAQVNFEDVAEQEKGFWETVGTGARAGVRGVGAFAEGLWEEGLMRPIPMFYVC